MGKTEEFLLDWSMRFLENKDAVKRDIKSLKAGKDGLFTADCKSGKKEYYIGVELNDALISQAKKDTSIGIFVLNNKKSIDFLLKNWEKISKNNKLMIYFINPFSKADKVWIINPYVHNMICDHESLNSGIKSMSDMVDSIIGSEVEGNIE